MTLKIDSKSPTADEINAIVQEAHKLRAQAFSKMLSKIGNGIKGSIYPKRAPRPAGNVNPA